MPDLFTENVKLSHRLQGIVNALGDEMAEVLKEASDRIAGKILLLEAKAEETKSLIRRKKWLRRQKAEVDKILSSIYADIGKAIKDKSLEVGQASPEVADKILKKVIPDKFSIKMGVPELSKKRVLAWFESSQIEGLFFNDYLKKLEVNAAQRIIRSTQSRGDQPH